MKFEYHKIQKEMIEVPPKTIVLGDACSEERLHIDHTLKKYHLLKYAETIPNHPLFEIVRRFMQMNELEYDSTVMFHTLSPDIILSCFLLSRPHLVETNDIDILLFPISTIESQKAIGKYAEERRVAKAFYKWMIDDAVKTFHSKKFERTQESVLKLLEESFVRIETWLNNNQMTIPDNLEPYKVIEKVRDFNYLVVEGSGDSLESLLFDTDEDRFLVYRTYPNQTTQYFILRRSRYVSEFPIVAKSQSTNTFSHFFAKTEHTSPDRSIWQGTETLLYTKASPSGEYSYLTLRQVKDAINLLILKNRVIIELEVQKAQAARDALKTATTSIKPKESFADQVAENNKIATPNTEFEAHLESDFKNQIYDHFELPDSELFDDDSLNDDFL